ncbi:non-heme iron oxygenase ferredoxin subunit [Trueperella pyogenes]|uniref:non-heme iron oxygenase ferredoxin subunit n=1 Tax=Trueperella pyogenes TaxID=1661 RepID=UPI00043B1D6E|nr:non-heme iron oxygenase ferredoxin subunit [Trueperella pyogenes]AHU88688.1 Rieske (2Fe-2S) protein [Trueperella pyogenes]AWA42550.1 non-heme iron oxygenase ferredoxin subunit [Trueperella pyogenes]AZR00481.1 non-heme iron oxygenase ferredoxin subunit [Trueperella pyogenes]AZR03531.1 non-heme iron oxygenase ferredoxin subunit [Trueperella pyogenes]OQD40424.1 hypothetical protein B1R42_00080 [Trueperella pyogenes]
MSIVEVCSTSDVAPGNVGGFTVDGKAIAVIHSATGRWFAMDDRCSHGRFKLSMGEVFDEEIECTRHGAVFSVETGQPLCPPATAPVQTYPVRVDGTSVLLTL